jgi:hypothetical protein
MRLYNYLQGLYILYFVGYFCISVDTASTRPGGMDSLTAAACRVGRRE